MVPPSGEDLELQALRTQLSELNARSRAYSAQMWQLPLAYLTAAGLILPKLQAVELGWVSLAALVVGAALLWHLLSLEESRRRAVGDLQKIEEALGLTRTALNRPGQTWPLIVLVGIGALGFLALGIVVLRHTTLCIENGPAVSGVASASLLSDQPTFVAIAEVISSAVIAAFAALQWWLSRTAENARKAERNADQLAQADAAYAAVYAEYFRLWTVSEQWRGADLTDPAIVASLSPEDVLPRDWASITEHLGQLGYFPAFLGSFGLALAFDAGKYATALFGEVMALDQLKHANPAAAAALTTQHLPRLQSAEKTLKDLTTEAERILQDALAHTAPAKVVRRPILNEQTHSRFTKAIAEQLNQAGVAAPGSLRDMLVKTEPREAQAALGRAQLEEAQRAPLKQLVSLAQSLLASLRQLPGPGADAQSRADALIRNAVLPRDEDVNELRKLAAAVDPAMEPLARAVIENLGWLLNWARQVQATNPTLGFDYNRIKWPEWVFRRNEAEQALKRLGGD